jgi:hypothetical protein
VVTETGDAGVRSRRPAPIRNTERDGRRDDLSRYEKKYFILF